MQIQLLKSIIIEMIVIYNERVNDQDIVLI